jgi:peptidoglycan-associated lipoprotein
MKLTNPEIARLLRRAHAAASASRRTLLGAMAVSTAMGCTASPPPPANGTPSPTLPAPPPREPRALEVSLSADLSPCGPAEDAFFRFDSSALRPREREALRKLGSCLSTEPFDQSLLLVIGRADERGDAEYNLSLGRRRAERVVELLEREGVDRQRMLVMSRGEADALGHEVPEISQGYDRRVDVLLLDPVSPGPPARPTHRSSEPVSERSARD